MLFIFRSLYITNFNSFYLILAIHLGSKVSIFLIDVKFRAYLKVRSLFKN